jgi:hypothetical protein
MTPCRLMVAPSGTRVDHLTDVLDSTTFELVDPWGDLFVTREAVEFERAPSGLRVRAYPVDVLEDWKQPASTEMALAIAWTPSASERFQARELNRSRIAWSAFPDAILESIERRPITIRAGEFTKGDPGLTVTWRVGDWTSDPKWFGPSFDVLDPIEMQRVREEPGFLERFFGFLGRGFRGR